MEGLQGFSTLTYHDNWEQFTGKDCKKHWDTLLKRIRRKYPDIYGLWFFEFQKRGAPHFHFLTNHYIDSSWLRRNWNDIVDPENAVHMRYGADSQKLRKPHAAGAYAAKYTAKSEQKQVPEGFQDVGRFWGIFGVAKTAKLHFAVGNKEFFNLIRMIRKGYRKHVQTYGRYKKHGKGLVGFTAYDCSGLLRQYLETCYSVEFPEFQGNPIEWHLVLHQKHIDSSSPHTMKPQSSVLDEQSYQFLPCVNS